MPLLDIFRPERLRPAPEPLPVALRPVVLIGMSAWLIALVVVVIAWFADGVPSSWVWTCVTGALLGLGGLVMLRRNSWR